MYGPVRGTSVTDIPGDTGHEAPGHGVRGGEHREVEAAGLAVLERVLRALDAGGTEKLSEVLGTGCRTISEAWKLR